ncbi:hypothetical protein chiPu_0021814 [Chiloscyllium punctatum]|uniref:Uncharacterized protein n=1 Tax=Chiloscyllium punctatum TaxID=137246 RepID=A0A401RMI4_CHIPU|nr:hypothetical protein [Chiloscyllium punctatum]
MSKSGRLCCVRVVGVRKAKPGVTWEDGRPGRVGSARDGGTDERLDPVRGILTAVGKNEGRPRSNLPNPDTDGGEPVRFSANTLDAPRGRHRAEGQRVPKKTTREKKNGSGGTRLGHDQTEQSRFQ